MRNSKSLEIAQAFATDTSINLHIHEPNLEKNVNYGDLIISNAIKSKFLFDIIVIFQPHDIYLEKGKGYFASFLRKNGIFLDPFQFLG